MIGLPTLPVLPFIARLAVARPVSGWALIRPMEQ
jgi:hypothetical protein